MIPCGPKYEKLVHPAVEPLAPHSVNKRIAIASIVLSRANATTACKPRSRFKFIGRLKC
jgi:hypothetical protein